MSTVTAINSCATTACAYNRGGCTAFAITVGGDAATPACSTFVSLDARGGLPVADAITIGEDTASCLSYEAR